MLSSMTGFSSQTVSLLLKSGSTISLEVELKSLNSKFFEASCKLPGSINFLEISIINLLKKKLVRGRLSLSVRVDGSGDLFERVVPALRVIKDYIVSIQEIKKQLKIPGELTISDVISLPNIFSFEKTGIEKGMESSILKIISKVGDQVAVMRRVEGKQLQEDLEKRFVLCGDYIDQIKKLFDHFIKQQKVEIKKLIVLSENGNQEAEKSLGERYELLNKIDIHEEIVRFRSHLKVINKLLKSMQIEKGRRLDFMLQELARETNTITAKCSKFEIGSVAVDIKVELEKAREQVQNIV